MKFATATNNSARRRAAFTLAEVLAALMFMAIVIPVAVQALHIASLSGEFSIREAEAARLGAEVLNESIVTTNWSSALSGTVVQNGHPFRYTLNSQPWSQDSTMELLTVEVMFSTGARQCSVHLNTLVASPSALVNSTMTGSLQ
jgi:hypothetical protein